MSTHTHHHMIQGPFRSSDPLDDLITYFEVNGYSVASRQSGELPAGFAVLEEAEPVEEAEEAEPVEEAEPAEEAEPVEEAEEAEPAEAVLSGVVKATLVRGTKNASLWSSDMSDLLAEVRVEALNSGIKISYEVVTTGQHLNEDDLAFWRREAANAEKFVCGKVDSAIDWRTNESIRVEQQQREIVFFGVKAMILTMVLVFFGYQMAC